jgi:DNA-binding NtrC family response regulator
VRELENAVEHAVIVEETAILGVDSLPRNVRKCRGQGLTDDFTRALGLRDKLRVLEKQIIIDSLVRANGVKKQAAAMLRIDARNMPYFMRKHRLVDDSSAG